MLKVDAKACLKTNTEIVGKIVEVNPDNQSGYLEIDYPPNPRVKFKGGKERVFFHIDEIELVK